MRPRNRGVFVIIATVLFYNFVFATPSTQIWIPSTDVQGFGVIHLGWDSYIKTKQDTVNHGFEGSVTNGGITVGVLPFKKLGLEIGIDYRDIGANAGSRAGSNHLYPLYFNAKLGVPEDAFFKFQPAIAVGSFDLGTKTSGAILTNNNVTYGLIAKNIWKIGRISAGYYQGNDNLLYNASTGKKDASGVLLSWDRTITEISDKFWLAVDYMGAKNGYGALSFGGAYYITPDASFIIGYDIFNDDKTYKPTATVQVDINLPAVQDWFKKAEKK